MLFGLSLQFRQSRYLRWLKSNIIILFILAGFIGSTLLITKANQILEFDTDEGINLMIAMLYEQGFSLYTQIWTDQPPLFMVLLSGWFQVIGQSILSGRLLVLAFSVLLLAAFHQILRLTIGKLPALVGVVLLAISWFYIRLSISIMIGLPAFAAATISIYCAVLYKQKRYPFLLFASGIALALSLHIKLITIFLIPVIAIYLIEVGRSPQQKQRFSLKLDVLPAIIWFISFIAMFLLIGLLFNSFHPEQLIQIHISERAKSAAENYASFRYMMRLLRQDQDYLILAAIGTVSVLIKRDWNGFIPIAWFISAFLLLATHNPVWYHHYLLLSIPMVWLAAYAIALAITIYRHTNSLSQLSKVQFGKRVLSGLVVVLLTFAIVKTPERLTRPINKIPVQDQRVLSLIDQYKNQTHWILTDRPIYAFQAGLSVPPELAVMSRKRFNSEQLTFDDLIAVLEAYQPEQIVFARYVDDVKQNAALRRYINQHYVKTYRNRRDPIEHFVDRRIAQVK